MSDGKVVENFSAFYIEIKEHLLYNRNGSN